MGINGKGLMSTLILTGFWNRFLTGSGSWTWFFFRFHLVNRYLYSTKKGINRKVLMSRLILTGFRNRFLTGSGSETGFLSVKVIVFFQIHFSRSSFCLTNLSQTFLWDYFVLWLIFCEARRAEQKILAKILNFNREGV